MAAVVGADGPDVPPPKASTAFRNVLPLPARPGLGLGTMVQPPPAEPCSISATAFPEAAWTLLPTAQAVLPLPTGAIPVR